MKYLKQLLLTTENKILIQKIQYHLNSKELEELNNQLYKFAKKCMLKRPNPTLKRAIYLVQAEYKNANSDPLNKNHSKHPKLD